MFDIIEKTKIDLYFMYSVFILLFLHRLNDLVDYVDIIYHNIIVINNSYLWG